MPEPDHEATWPPQEQVKYISQMLKRLDAALHHAGTSSSEIQHASKPESLWAPPC